MKLKRAMAAIVLVSAFAAPLDTMTEAVTIDRPSTKPASVSASALALHLDCSATYVAKLEAEGVLHRAPDGSGFDVDASRVAYLRYLRREKRQSPRSEAHADHVKVKTEILQLRLMEKRRELVWQVDVGRSMACIAGVTLTALSSLPARCAPRGDLATRRNIERVVFEVRTEMANVCQQMADKCSEPPLDQQD
jgi:hypothetical protein